MIEQAHTKLFDVQKMGARLRDMADNIKNGSLKTRLRCEIYFVALLIFYDAYKYWSSSVCNCLYPLTFLPWVCSQTRSICHSYKTKVFMCILIFTFLYLRKILNSVVESSTTRCSYAASQNFDESDAPFYRSAFLARGWRNRRNQYSSRSRLPSCRVPSTWHFSFLLRSDLFTHSVSRYYKCCSKWLCLRH